MTNPLTIGNPLGAALSSITPTLSASATASTSTASTRDAQATNVAPAAAPDSGVGGLVDLFSHAPGSATKNLWLSFVKLPPLDSSLDTDD